MLVVSKEDVMRRLLLSLTPANLLHTFGTGGALDNVRREREEVAATMAIVDALVGRLEENISAATPAAALAAA